MEPLHNEIFFARARKNAAQDSSVLDVHEDSLKGDIACAASTEANCEKEPLYSGSKVRFAPSPTGYLHAGNIRIAVFNYLFAKKNDGVFVLRIDDTDVERSSRELEKLMLEDLTWVGITWDEFYRQSERIDRYISAMEHLKNIGRIYPCYETKEELALKRKAQAMSGIPPVYDRASLHLDDDQKKQLESNGVRPYWRFKLDDTKSVEWNDLVHGKISIPLNSVSDPILIKPDGSFVYTFASVVDDIDIGITHIIRGDDHVTNTATQIDIFTAICGSSPEFAHVPLMSSPDGQEVSKRVGSPFSICNMRKDGILPEAIFNFLASLGTSNNLDPNDTIDTLIEKFSFEKMSLASSKFYLDDLKQLSRKILSEKSFENVKDSLQQLELENISEVFWNTIRGNIDTTQDAVFWHSIYYQRDAGPDNKTRVLQALEDEKFMRCMLDSLTDPFVFDDWIANLKKASGKKGKDLFHPIRVVLTGVDHGPELKKITSLMGYDRIKQKIEKSLEVFK
ncbi:glutamate--tRNA ligase [Alphaproteobacteria bacterium]|nr:glutamate--tRNA ligase [Alphaproteobacteria bacterium]